MMVKRSEFLGKHFLLDKKDLFLFQEKSCHFRSELQKLDFLWQFEKKLLLVNDYIKLKFWCHIFRNNAVSLLTEKKSL